MDQAREECGVEGDLLEPFGHQIGATHYVINYVDITERKPKQEKRKSHQHEGFRQSDILKQDLHTLVVAQRAALAHQTGTRGSVRLEGFFTLLLHAPAVSPSDNKDGHV